MPNVKPFYYYINNLTFTQKALREKLKSFKFNFSISLSLWREYLKSERGCNLASIVFNKYSSLLSHIAKTLLLNEIAFVLFG